MSRLDKIKGPVGQYVEEFHHTFEELLSSKSELMAEAVQRLADASGKMVRPIMTTLMAGLYGKDIPKETVLSAVLLEMIHTATLIHDDVIDNSLQRRSRPTLNVFFDNRLAVLMGDFVLSSALIGAMSLQNIRIISVVSSIGRELTEGEIRQFETAERTILDESVYMDVIRQKTAMLFRSCAEVAGITVQAPEEEIQALAHCGELLGLAFQIRDDIFDYYKDDVGKPTGHDLLEGKITLPLLHCLLEDGGKTPEGRVCLDLVKQKDLNDTELEQLTSFAKKRGGIDYAQEKIQALLSEARAIIEPYAPSEYRSSLLELINFIGSRAI